jgi:hypothetical protein
MNLLARLYLMCGESKRKVRGNELFILSTVQEGYVLGNF